MGQGTLSERVTFNGTNSAIFIFATLFHRGQFSKEKDLLPKTNSLTNSFRIDAILQVQCIPGKQTGSPKKLFSLHSQFDSQFVVP